MPIDDKAPFFWKHTDPEPRGDDNDLKSGRQMDIPFWCADGAAH